MALSLFIQHAFFQALAAGLAITDVSALAHSLTELHGLDNLLFTRRYDLGGLMLLYAPAYRLSPLFYPLINAALLFGAALVYKRLVIDRLTHGDSFVIAMLGLVGNPFFLLTMAGPNKEIPLLLLTLLLAWQILDKSPGWFWRSALIAVAASALRDGYGALLLAFAVMHWVAHRLRSRVSGPWLVVGACILLSIIVAALIHPLSQWLSFLHRNLAVAARISGVAQVNLAADGNWLLHAVPAMAAWARRVVLNASSLALFPVIRQENGSVYWIGVAYWLFGIGNLYALACAAYAMVLPARRLAATDGPAPAQAQPDRGNTVKAMAADWLALLLLSSVSVYVQPRYLMVTLPLGIGVMAMTRPRARLVILLLVPVLVSSVLIVYQLKGLAFPTVAPDTFPVDPYLAR
jgi:hypothetical protein